LAWSVLSYVPDGEDRADSLAHDVLRGRSDEGPLNNALRVCANHNELSVFLGSHAKNRAIGLTGLDTLLDVYCKARTAFSTCPASRS
jgi:hypothetical protein